MCKSDWKTSHSTKPLPTQQCGIPGGKIIALEWSSAAYIADCLFCSQMRLCKSDSNTGIGNNSRLNMHMDMKL